MSSQPTSITFTLPEWITAYTGHISTIPDLQNRMSFVIEASRKNIEHETGGPFAAAVFEIGSGKLISLGVNCVVSQKLFLLHAEIVALAIAQKKLNSHDLSSHAVIEHELITSTEPCAMCFGAIQWAGLKRVVSGAKDEDARLIGFDEGIKVSDWKTALQLRGIEVISEMHRQEATNVLSDYLKQGGQIYNPGGTDPSTTKTK